MEKYFTHYNDQDLLSLIQKKDEKAFTLLFERYYSFLYKKAFLRIPSTMRVEEIVQDVFINLWVKAPELAPEGNVKAYLFATLRNKVLHELRTEGNRVFYMKKWKEHVHKQVKAKGLDNIYARETEEAIQKEIKQLSPKCRTAFQLSRYKGLSYKEIAEKMNISIRTVEKHIGKALQTLKKELAPYQESTFVLFIFILSYILY